MFFPISLFFFPEYSTVAHTVAWQCFSQGYRIRNTGYGIRDTGYEIRSGFWTNTVIKKTLLTSHLPYSSHHTPYTPIRYYYSTVHALRSVLPFIIIIKVARSHSPLAIAAAAASASCFCCCTSLSKLFPFRPQSLVGAGALPECYFHGLWCWLPQRSNRTICRACGTRIPRLAPLINRVGLVHRGAACNKRD